MGFTRTRVSRSAAATPAYSPQQRSLFASRPFAPVEQEADEAALGTDAAVPLQAKLAIGQPGDRYEQEADRVASTVVNQIAAPQSPSVQREAMPEEEEDLQMKPLAGSSASLVQREAMPEEEEDLQMKPLAGSNVSLVQREAMPEKEEDLQMKPLAGSNASLVQREEMPEEEEDLQMKPVQRVAEAGGAEASPDLETSIAQARGGGQPLDQSIRAPMEQSMGADFSGVKVHTDAQADQLNRSVQAKAFTTGQDVFFRQGEYNPGSRGGQELIAHELAHVIQQGGVPGTPFAAQQGAVSARVQRKFKKATENMNIDLQEEEDSGGHTIARHVGKGEDYVAGRISADKLEIASSYPDRATAQGAITENIRANHTDINNMIFDPTIRERQTLAVRSKSNKTIGGYLTENNVQDKKGRLRKSKALKETQKTVVVVRKLDGGAFLLTSFPEP